ncbi:MAG: hypothetical protein ACFFAS_21260 [Promethearchaeota archaeon]
MSTMEDKLRDSLENIIFQEENLKSVMKILINLIPAKSKSEKAVEAVIRARYQLLETLLSFISFHLNHQIELWKMDQFANASDNLKLEQELKEKNVFLKEIAQRVENIYEKLVKK